MTKKILIASDHAGFPLKEQILNSLKSEKLVDLGTNSEESVDYPDFANKLASQVNTEEESIGILICGSGIGMAIAANRYKNVRAGLAFNTDIAKLMREHNNANVLVLPGRFMDVHMAIKCINIFIASSFKGGRHAKRINKLS
tara:strand:- start:181 stop:606 length:426 start_codon:yes stop_codon:yes gene_type:complete